MNKNQVRLQEKHFRKTRLNILRDKISITQNRWLKKQKEARREEEVSLKLKNITEIKCLR